MECDATGLDVMWIDVMNSGFQVTGIITKDFLGFEIVDSRIFWVGKFGK